MILHTQCSAPMVYRGSLWDSSGMKRPKLSNKLYRWQRTAGASALLRANCGRSFHNLTFEDIIFVKANDKFVLDYFSSLWWWSTASFAKTWRKLFAEVPFLVILVVDSYDVSIQPQLKFLYSWACKNNLYALCCGSQR